MAIYVDSQAALKALESYYLKSMLVGDCLIAIRELVGHSDVESNEVADEMARQGSTMDIPRVEIYIIPTLALIFAEIRKWTNHS